MTRNQNNVSEWSAMSTCGQLLQWTYDFMFCVLCFLIKRCSVRLYLQLFVGELMSYLRYLCLFAYSGVQHILTIWVSCTRQDLLDLHGCLGSPRFVLRSLMLIVLVFCVVFVLFVLVLCLVCPMLPVSLDCPFFIALSVFSNVYYLK